MSYDAARAAIEGRFAGLWSAAHADIPVQYGNMPFDTRDLPAGSSWVRLYLEFGDEQQADSGSPGSNRQRHIGVIGARVNVPKGEGDGDAIRLAEEIRDYFYGQDFNGVRCRTRANLRDMTDDNSAFVTKSVTVPYYYDRFA